MSEHELAHADVVDAIAGVMAKILPELLEEYERDVPRIPPILNVKHAVVEVMKRYKLPVSDIERAGSWPPLLESATPYQRRVFIATVQAIYQR